MITAISLVTICHQSYRTVLSFRTNPESENCSSLYHHLALVKPRSFLTWVLTKDLYLPSQSVLNPTASILLKNINWNTSFRSKPPPNSPFLSEEKLEFSQWPPGPPNVALVASPALPCFPFSHSLGTRAHGRPRSLALALLCPRALLHAHTAPLGPSSRLCSRLSLAGGCHV